MNSCIDSVKQELDESIRLRENINRRLNDLKDCDGWYINYTVVKGHSYYQMIKKKTPNTNNSTTKTKRKRIKKYLGKSTNPKVGRLQEHRLLTEARQICNTNIDSLDALVAAYQELDPDKIIKNLGVAYQECAGFSDKVLGIPSASEWKRQALEKRDSIPRYKPENLMHTSNSGEKMRTRGEVIFANILDTLGADYVYELPTDINGHMMIPDFTILHPKTKEIMLIEYMGMYGEENYRFKNTIKISEYFSAGYILGKNLFVFMDGEEGHFDAQIIKKVIEAILQ